MKIRNAIFKIVVLVMFARIVIGIVGEDSLSKKCTAETMGTVVSVSSGTVEKMGKIYEHYNATVEPDEANLFGAPKLLSENTFHKYAEGEKVTIYYNPNNTDLYYIEYAEPKKNGFMIAGVIFLLLIPTVLTVVCKLKRSGLT